MGNYINEIQKYKYYDKIKEKGMTRECPICGDVVRKDQVFEIVIRKNKQKRIYHKGCIIEEIRR